MKNNSFFETTKKVAFVSEDNTKSTPNLNLTKLSPFVNPIIADGECVKTSPFSNVPGFISRNNQKSLYDACYGMYLKSRLKNIKSYHEAAMKNVHSGVGYDDWSDSEKTKMYIYKYEDDCHNDCTLHDDHKNKHKTYIEPELRLKRNQYRINSFSIQQKSKNDPLFRKEDKKNILYKPLESEINSYKLGFLESKTNELKRKQIMNKTSNSFYRLMQHSQAVAPP